jgi:hypothetical protein
MWCALASSGVAALRVMSAQSKARAKHYKNNGDAAEASQLQPPQR